MRLILYGGVARREAEIGAAGAMVDVLAGTAEVAVAVDVKAGTEAPEERLWGACWLIWATDKVGLGK